MFDHIGIFVSDPERSYLLLDPDGNNIEAIYRKT